MKVLRIKLTQSKAHYRKEESDKNKMTYPLPPLSTVIGALHNACKFREYHPMDLSIQGSYESVTKQPYTDYCFLDSVMDDRGTLVKMKSPTLHSIAFKRVAEAVKSTGNSFRKDITIRTFNKELMTEYRELKNLNDEIAIFKKNRIDKLKKLFKKRKTMIKLKKKSFDKKSEEFKHLTLREKEITSKEKMIESKYKEYLYENYTREISKYQSLTTSLKYYEILNNIELILHIKSDDETLKTINENIYNLKSIGRSEDFVNIEECILVDLDEELELEDEVKSEYSAYLNYYDVKEDKIFIDESKNGIAASGTKYYLNKEYKIIDNQRIFKKKKVLYTSNYFLEDIEENLYFDGEFIVNFN